MTPLTGNQICYYRSCLGALENSIQNQSRKEERQRRNYRAQLVTGVWVISFIYSFRNSFAYSFNSVDHLLSNSSIDALIFNQWNHSLVLNIIYYCPIETKLYTWKLCAWLFTTITKERHHS